MEQNVFFTAGQFAQLHGLNKRTLHYYDDIGLFSPARKGENGYRYYTYRQSAELENILMLRELGMSIEEIKGYSEHPNAGDFMKIAAQKTCEIDRQIRQLRNLKALLQEKQDALSLCEEIQDGKIEVVPQKKTCLLLTPAHITESDSDGMEQIMEHLRASWACNACKTGCGSYISIDKVKRGEFNSYDGLYTPIDRPERQGHFHIRPAGNYLRGYCIGDWGKIPGLYIKMLDFARANDLVPVGNCYEIGLNEFAISNMEEYVTRIEIQCK